MQSYFPDEPVTATYVGKTDIPLEPQPIFSRPKGSKPEVIIWALVTTRRRQDI